MNLFSRCSLVSLFLVLFAFGTMELSAQGSCPPTPDCHTDPWIGPNSVSFTMYGPNGEECEFTVWFCYRIACGMYYDMYITSVTVDADCFGVFPNDAILDQAMREIWKANPWGASIPLCPGGTTAWRVFSAGCYASVPPGGCGIIIDPPPTGVMTMNPCHESAQCFGLYRICRTPSGSIVETLISTSPAGSCTGEVAGCPCSHWCPGD